MSRWPWRRRRPRPMLSADMKRVGDAWAAGIAQGILEGARRPPSLGATATHDDLVALFMPPERARPAPADPVPPHETPDNTRERDPAMNDPVTSPHPGQYDATAEVEVLKAALAEAHDMLEDAREGQAAARAEAVRLGEKATGLEQTLGATRSHLADVRRHLEQVATPAILDVPEPLGMGVPEHMWRVPDTPATVQRNGYDFVPGTLEDVHAALGAMLRDHGPAEVRAVIESYPSLGLTRRHALGVECVRADTSVMGEALRLVVLERGHQVAKGYTSQHDQDHGPVDLARLAQDRLARVVRPGKGVSIPHLIQVAAMLVSSVEVWITEHPDGDLAAALGGMADQ